MRVYGRILTDPTDQDSATKWVVVETDSDGNDTYCYITALIQCLKLNLNESPFYADKGIPAQQTIMTQIFPDYYVANIQNYYSQFFASLLINRVPQTEQDPSAVTYNVNITTKQGTKYQTTVAR